MSIEIMIIKEKKKNEFIKTYFDDFQMAKINENDKKMIWARILYRIRNNKVEDQSNGLLFKFFVRQRGIAASIAAMLCLLIGTLSIYLAYTNRSIEWIEVRTMDSRKEIELPDGTKVKLNVNTVFHYADNFHKNRIVKLDGAATFDVIPEKKGRHDNDFKVMCDGYEIIVKGTYFDVWSYSSDIITTTSLYSGEIEMSIGDNNIELYPNQKLTFNKKEMSLDITSVSGDDAEWVKGVYSFYGERLDNLVEVLSRVYNVQYKFIDDQLKSVKFTGRIREKNSLEHTLTLLRATTGINAQIEKNIIVISKP